MMTEKELSSFVGKEIKITFNDGEVLSGNCVYFTKALDNEPEIPSISVQTKERGTIEVSQNEVKIIELM